MTRDPLPTFTNDELAKLPKWARDKVVSLSWAAHRLEKELAVAIGENPPTCVEVRPLGAITGTPLNLGNDARVRFYLGDNPNRQDWIDVDLVWTQKGRLNLGIQVRASSGVVTYHDASNAMIVSLEGFIGKLAALGRTP